MIQLNDVNMKIGDFSISHVSANFEKGRCHVLLGNSGSGKTVLLEAIAGLIPLDSGSILIGNRDVTLLPPEARQIGYLPQDYALFPRKNVYENIAFGLRIKQRFSEQEIDNRIVQVSKELGIAHLLHRNTQGLSGGEQQRVAVARALVIESNILMLDEPTAALDELMEQDFCLLLKRLQKQAGLTLLITTHRKNTAYMLGDDFHFIDNGKWLLSTTVANLNQTIFPAKAATLIGISNIFLFRKQGTDGNYYAPQLNISCRMPQAIHQDRETFKIGVKPKDIFIDNVPKEKLVCTFTATIEQITPKEAHVWIIVKVSTTDSLVNVELPSETFTDIAPKLTSMVMCSFEMSKIIQIF